MAFDRHLFDLIPEALLELESSFGSLPDFEAPVPGGERMRSVLHEVASRMGDNYPYFHPQYAGQMMKPPHPIAQAAYALAMWINPNNHAIDGGRASSQMEKEAVEEIAAMFGWRGHLGHLTGGGTMANLEALWIASQVKPGKTIVASRQAHYTHQRVAAILGVPFEVIECDQSGRMDLAALSQALATSDVGCVVATLGTTATGSVDPLPGIISLREKYGFRLHIDAAYGGYFGLADNLAEEGRAAFDLIGEADSIVIDPHKHGLQPYGCGCVLFRDPAVGTFYKHDSPYTYFSSIDLHLGEISLECSRPGASAVALWATQRLLPLSLGGEFAQGLSASRRAALLLHNRLRNDPRFIVGHPPELDIVVWAPRAESVSISSKLSSEVFKLAAKQGVHLALAHLPASMIPVTAADQGSEEARIVCLRSVLMKPEHERWVDRLFDVVSDSTDAALRNLRVK